jgi:tRNA(His) 5'-end guanylyltransferase
METFTETLLARPADYLISVTIFGFAAFSVVFIVSLVLSALKQMCCGLKRPKNAAQKLAERMKSLEGDSESRLDPDQPFVVRLDGHKFSKFTKGFEKPLDKILKNAMIAVAGELLTEFNAVTAYTASDEITLVFPPRPNLESTLIYNGRKQKICSLMAGYASTRFNHWLKCCVDVDPVFRKKDKLGIAYFDARVFSVVNDVGAYQAVFWRSHYDTYRNGVSILAQSHFSSKHLHRKSVATMKRMLLEKKVLMDDQDPHLFFGTFVKKRLVEVKGYDRKKKEEVLVKRGRIHYGQVHSDDLSPESGFIMAKYWNLPISSDAMS